MRNARGSDDDRWQIIADLLASDSSPFTPDDEEALRMSRDEILREYRDRYLKPKAAKQQHRANCLDGISKAELETMVANAVAEALAGHGLETNATTTTTRDARRAVVEKQARSLLSLLGIAKASDEQVLRISIAAEQARSSLCRGDPASQTPHWRTKLGMPAYSVPARPAAPAARADLAGLAHEIMLAIDPRIFR